MGTNLNYFSHDSSGSIRPAAEQAVLALGYQRQLAALTNPDCPTLVIFGDGLLPGAEFKVTFTQIMCGVADSRNWSLTQAPIPRHLSTHENAALATVQMIPKAMPGSTNRAHTRKITEMARKAYHALAEGWDYVKEYGPAVASSAGRLLSKVGMEDVGAVLTDLGSAGSLAEVAALLI
jgi:hypothetical protein